MKNIDIDCIIDSLYLGSCYAIKNIKDDYSKEFVACISIGSEFVLEDISDINCDFDQNIVTLPNLNLIGISHKHIPIDDNIDNVLCQYLPDFFHFMDEYINKGNVFVHCFAGISRSPSFVYAYLLHLGMDPVKAFELLTNKRGKVHPYNGFIDEILSYSGLYNKSQILKEIRSGLYYIK